MGRMPHLECKTMRSITAIALVEILFVGLTLGAQVNVNDLFFPTYNVGDMLEVSSSQMDQSNQMVQSKQMIQSPSSITIEYPYSQNGIGEATLIWRYPDGNKGDTDGRSLVGARRLVFSAKGENGGENVQFAVGSFTRDTAFIKETTDLSTDGSQERLNLTSDWKEYEIRLAGDLTNIRAGLGCTIFRPAGDTSTITVYLKDIYYEI